MKVIAVNTIHGRKIVRPADKAKNDPGQFEDIVVPPGEEFDTDDIGVDKKEASALIARGVAKRKTREVADEERPPAGKPAA